VELCEGISVDPRADFGESFAALDAQSPASFGRRDCSGGGEVLRIAEDRREAPRTDYCCKLGYWSWYVLTFAVIFVSTLCPLLYLIFTYLLIFFGDFLFDAIFCLTRRIIELCASVCVVGWPAGVGHVAFGPGLGYHAAADEGPLLDASSKQLSFAEHLTV
jgi:hypothetical protein